MAQECLAILNTGNGLWLTSVNSDGTYSFGNPADAVCFPTASARLDVLTILGNGFIGQNPPKPR